MKKILNGKCWSHVISSVFLLVIAFVVYSRILGHDFQLFWDDEKYITANETIREFSFANLKSAFAGSYLGNYAPILTFSYMLDHALYGYKASGYFLTNITLHACNGLFLYLLLIRLDFNKLWAFFSACIFLIHPVQVESVAWASERKNLLAMFFYIPAFAMYIVYREKGWADGKKAYLGSLILFVCSLMSKAVAVTFPLMLVLFDLCYVDEKRRTRMMTDVIPFVCAAAIMAWVTMQSQMPADMPGMGGGRTAYHGGSPYATFLTMLTVLALYLKNLLWPVNLSAIYDPVIRTGFDGAVAGSTILLAILAFVGVTIFKKNRRLFFWYGLFFIGLLPVSQIVPIVTLMNDRYLYFPMLGASVCFGGLFWLVESSSTAQKTMMLTLAGAILVALSLLSISRSGVWKNDLTLWRDAAEKAPANTVALYGYGQALQNSGNLDAALPLYLRILRHAPRHLDTLVHLGELYRSENQPLMGRPYLLAVTRYYPKLPKGYVDLGSNYYLTNDLAEAEKAFLEALTLQPKNREAAWYLGIICLRTKRPSDARGYFQKVAALGGTNADIEYNLACVESLSNHPKEALQHLESALRLGFSDKESLSTDKDLDSIRSLPAFHSLVSAAYGDNPVR